MISKQPLRLVARHAGETGNSSFARGVLTAREEIIAAATDVMQEAQYCSLTTVGVDGHPQARIVDPLEPDPDFTV